MYTSSGAGVRSCASPGADTGLSWSTLFSREREIDHNQTPTPPRNKQNSFDRVFCLFGLLPVSEYALEYPQPILSVAKSAHFLRRTIFVCLKRDSRIILETTSLVSVWMPQPPSNPPSLLAPTSRLDVSFDFHYRPNWHSTEEVLISLNYEGGTGTPMISRSSSTYAVSLTRDLPNDTGFKKTAHYIFRL